MGIRPETPDLRAHLSPPGVRTMGEGGEGMAAISGVDILHMISSGRRPGFTCPAQNCPCPFTNTALLRPSRTQIADWLYMIVDLLSHEAEERWRLQWGQEKFSSIRNTLLISQLSAAFQNQRGQNSQVSIRRFVLFTSSETWKRGKRWSRQHLDPKLSHFYTLRVSNTVHVCPWSACHSCKLCCTHVVTGWMENLRPSVGQRPRDAVHSLPDLRRQICNWTRKHHKKTNEGWSKGSRVCLGRRLLERRRLDIVTEDIDTMCAHPHLIGGLTGGASALQENPESCHSLATLWKAKITACLACLPLHLAVFWPLVSKWRAMALNFCTKYSVSHSPQPILGALSRSCVHFQLYSRQGLHKTSCNGCFI